MLLGLFGLDIEVDEWRVVGRESLESGLKGNSRHVGMEGEGEDEGKIRGYGRILYIIFGSIDLALETHLNFPGGHQGNPKTKIGIGCQERNVRI